MQARPSSAAASRVARGGARKFAKTFFVPAKVRRELPEDRAQFFTEAENPGSEEVGQRHLDVAQLLHVRDEARALDAKHEIVRRFGTPTLKTARSLAGIKVPLISIALKARPAYSSSRFLPDASAGKRRRHVWLVQPEMPMRRSPVPLRRRVPARAAPQGEAFFAHRFAEFFEANAFFRFTETKPQTFAIVKLAKTRDRPRGACAPVTASRLSRFRAAKERKSGRHGFLLSGKSG